ncbi:hypothetical protein T439DRAFT_357238 [Meredithblackwellia eburnea MCA 4105]
MAAATDNRRQTIYSKASTSSDSNMDPSTQMFTIGKIDGTTNLHPTPFAAGIAVLISDSVHLIEFPSLLLPSGVGPGSIVNISCSRNIAAERATSDAFWDLQQSIYDEYGAHEPEPPTLRVRNTTQTSVTLEWDKLQLAQAKLLGLSMWRNGQRLMTIPNPLTNTSTKLSGLAVDTDYSFHLVLKTSAGTFTSPTVKIRTHTIENTSGVTVCFGLCEPESLLKEAKAALDVMKGRHSDKIQIDTTHFVATSPAAVDNPTGGPGVEYQRALQLSIPVVSPEWVIACARESKMVPIANYYSIGTTNHAASLSSAQLVTPNGSIPPSKPSQQALPRRATAVTIEEEPSQPVPVVAPAPTTLPRSELAEEEPDAPPAEEVAKREIPVHERPEIVEAPPRETVPAGEVEQKSTEPNVATEESRKDEDEEDVVTPTAAIPALDMTEETEDLDGVDELVKGTAATSIKDEGEEVEKKEEPAVAAVVGNESMEEVGL